MSTRESEPRPTFSMGWSDYKAGVRIILDFTLSIPWTDYERGYIAAAEENQGRAKKEEPRK